MKIKVEVLGIPAFILLKIHKYGYKIITACQNLESIDSYIQFLHLKEYSSHYWDHFSSGLGYC